MRPLLLISALSTLLSFNTLKAQDVFEKGGTLKLAFILPASDFGSFPASLQTQYVIKKANLGFGLQFGKMYFLNFVDLGDKMKIGIDVTWFALNYQSVSHTFNVTRLDGSGLFINSQGTFDMSHLYLYSEVGPSFSFSPLEKMALDFSLKATPTFAFQTGQYHVESNGGDNERPSGYGFGFRFTPAFYLRYSKLLIGVEYNLGNVFMNYESSGGAFSGTYTGSANYNTLRVVLGLKF